MRLTYVYGVPAASAPETQAPAAARPVLAAEPRSLMLNDFRYLTDSDKTIGQGDRRTLASP